MFDLNYFNNLRKQKEWIDEFKGNLFSRKNSSIFKNIPNNKIIENKIDELPDFMDFKEDVCKEYLEKGQTVFIPV